MRDAVYDEIGPAERRKLHAAIADELGAERRGGAPLDIAELATHVAESADPGDEHAVEVLLEAGRTVSVTAPLVAAEHYSRGASSCCRASRRGGRRRSRCARGRCTSARARPRPRRPAARRSSSSRPEPVRGAPRSRSS